MGSHIVDIPKFSNDFYLYLIIWLPVFAAIIAGLSYVQRDETKPTTPLRSGPLDRFRVGGAFVLAAFTAAFTFAFSDDPGNAIPGINTKDSIWLWCTAHVISLVSFGILCGHEARNGIPEAFGLRVYWVIELLAWLLPTVVRTDYLATDGLAHPEGSAAAAFYVMTILGVALFACYSLFTAQSRFPSKGIRKTNYETLSPSLAASLIDDKVVKHEAPVEKDRLNPELFAGPLSLAYFAWMTPLVYLGYTRPLEQDDLEKLHPSDDPTHLNKLFQEAWSEQLKKDEPSLFLALVKAFGRTYFIGAAQKFVYDAQQFVGPLLLQKTIVFLSSRDSDDKEPMRVGYELCFFLFINNVSQSIILHQYFHAAFRTGMRLKASIISAIYDKSLKVKPGAPGADKKDVRDTVSQSKPSELGLSLAPVKAKKGEYAKLADEASDQKEEVNEEEKVEEKKEDAEADMASKKKTTGEVVNLMAVDAQRLQDTMSYIAMIWSGVFQIGLCLWYLFDLLGYATFAGLFIMVTTVPLTGRISLMSRQLQKRVMNIKDNRIKVENEVLGGMKIIKLYAWERPFARKIHAIRDRELESLWDYKRLQIASRMLWTIVPTLVSICTFTLFTLLGHQLTASTAFTALALFNILRFPLALLPMAIANAVEATLSLERIRSFLISPEVKPLPPVNAPLYDSDDDDDDETVNPLASAGEGEGEGGGGGTVDNDYGETRLSLKNATLAWDNGAPLLSDLSFDVSDGELCMVVGQTGSGKSGLLTTIIGELVPTEGKVRSCGSIAYVSQVAWIQNATLKDNILFGQPFDAVKYASVIDDCCLTADLLQLADGDQTEIGEKGINLSGGQKQRVSIARAVYADADIYLLDDCLSAVDSQVGHHIFDRVIKGALKDKAVLLVSHNLQLLPQADKVVLLDNNRALYVGPFENFLSVDHDLAKRCKDNAQQHAEAQQESESALTITTKEDAVAVVASSIKKAKKDKKDKKKDEESGDGKLIEKEAMVRGSVAFATYKLYIEACGNVMALVGVIGGLIIYNFSAAVASWWLGYWADNAGSTGDDDLVDDAEAGDDDDGGSIGSSEGLSIYVIISFASIGISFIAIITATVSGQRACRKFHEQLVEGVLRAPMAFFDTTPLGRIVNRFSKDMYTLDEVLPYTLYSWASCAISCVVAVATVTFVIPWFLVACVPMGWVYYRIMIYYIPTSRELQRLESVTRSPVFSHFGETLEGVSTIRAFRSENIFIADSMDKLERNLRSYYANVSSNRWLALRLEGIGTCFVTFASILAVTSTGISGGEGGLALTYALSITQTLNWYVRMSSDRESQVVAVERLAEYADIVPEAPAIIENRRPPPEWPTQGKIDFQRCAMRYRPNLPLVLKGDNGLGLECAILPKQKVGVVGRTGAGKSSLLLVLLRLVEPDAGGKLLIDGLDVLKMGLDDLRSRISIIPQDPVLFTGSVRFNLDPFEDHDDAAVWNALERAHLGKHIRQLPEGLAAEVEEGGRNFSMGERQLLCLARALLRASRILLLDEATSAVDHHTDALVQETIRVEFKECTVLTIAHRLDTIIDYDRVLVLSDGKVVEDDEPKALLDSSKYPDGIFKSMWDAHEAGML
jgi:ABC-type multidrug transport system fused ATPase/permease subunit